MSFGNNVQYLRKQQRITQEKLAERMKVSRQTVSKWEMDEAIPDINKLIELCELFSCKMDALVREDMTAQDIIYSDITLQTVNAFKMARYVMITPNPEDDVNTYMKQWGQKSGLAAYTGDLKMIGWDFPFVSAELQNRFNMRGHVAAYILPEGFTTTYPGVEYAEQDDAVYAVITVTDPFQAAFERIPNAYKKILEYLQANGFKENRKENIIPCFEHVYEKDGTTYMDVFIHADGVMKANMYNAFS